MALHTRRREARAVQGERVRRVEEERAGFLWAWGKPPPFVPPMAGGAGT